MLGQEERCSVRPLGRHCDQRAETVRRRVAQVDLGWSDGEGLQQVVQQAQRRWSRRRSSAPERKRRRPGGGRRGSTASPRASTPRPRCCRTRRRAGRHGRGPRIARDWGGTRRRRRRWRSTEGAAPAPADRRRRGEAQGGVDRWGPTGGCGVPRRRCSGNIQHAVSSSPAVMASMWNRSGARPRTIWSHQTLTPPSWNGYVPSVISETFSERSVARTWNGRVSLHLREDESRCGWVRRCIEPIARLAL